MKKLAGDGERMSLGVFCSRCKGCLISAAGALCSQKWQCALQNIGEGDRCIGDREPLRLWKARLLAHCGIDPAREDEFGLALGFAALNDSLSAASCDLQTGDRLTLYERQSSALAGQGAFRHLAASSGI